MYEIKPYSIKKAKELGVTIMPSKKKNKKIDVFKNGEKIATIGDSRYNDYPTYLQSKGDEYAKKRRLLYKIRHSKDRNIIGSKGYYADKILW